MSEDETPDGLYRVSPLVEMRLMIERLQKRLEKAEAKIARLESHKHNIPYKAWRTGGPS